MDGNWLIKMMDCLNEYQILSILFPSKNNHYDSRGNIFKYDDKIIGL